MLSPDRINFGLGCLNCEMIPPFEVHDETHIPDSDHPRVATGGAANVRSASQGRARDRSEEQYQQGDGCRHSGRKIARVAANIPASDAKKTVDAAGLYVTPGLIDLHTHVYTRADVKALVAGENNVQPDAFSFRSGVTTMVDAGTSGWRTFPQFRERIIDRAKTRVLALLNIAGYGMGTGKENEVAELDADAAASMAKANADVIIGFKSAHFNGPGWESVENAVKAGKLADLPVMIDFGYTNQQRNINTLLLDKLRPGDIYTHCYSGHREELLENGKVNPAMVAGR